MSKTSNKTTKDKTLSSCVHSDDEKLVTEIPIVLAGLNGNEMIAHAQKDCTHHLLEFDNIIRNPTEEKKRIKRV